MELFQNIGLFLCVGGLIVAALIAFAVTSFMRRSGNNTTTNQTNQPSVFNQRGNERPEYDSQRVESRGGFGGNVDTDNTGDRPIPQTGRQDGGFGNARQFESDADIDRKPKRDDDDNIRSSGGFGG